MHLVRAESCDDILPPQALPPESIATALIGRGGVAVGCSCAEAAGATSCCTPAPCVAAAVAIELAGRQPFGGCNAFKDLCDTDIVELFGDSDSENLATGLDEDIECKDGSQMEQGGLSENDSEEVEWGEAEEEAETEATLVLLSRCSIPRLPFTQGTCSAVPRISLSEHPLTSMPPKSDPAFPAA